MAGKSSGALQVTLPSDKEILMQRVFDAPRHLVYEAMTKPEHIRVWWCCMPELTMPVCEIDFRVGGAYRFVTRTPDGNEFAFRGVYREIVAPQKWVHTEIFEPFPDEETICTVTLEERDGETHYRCHILHKTTQGRDAHISSGMEGGANIALDRVEEIARSLLAKDAPRGGAQTSGATAHV
jgi:uncharacterized protein YndB with AHSA1/START domain